LGPPPDPLHDPLTANPGRPGAFHDQFADRLAHRHELIDADAALVTRPFATVAPAAAVEDNLLALLGFEPQALQGLYRRRIGFLTMRADGPGEPLPQPPDGG